MSVNTGAMVWLAVADQGGSTQPVRQESDQIPTEETGRGLKLIAALATDYGAEGDSRGRVVWARFRLARRRAAGTPLYPQPANDEDAAMLAARYTRWHTWFGPWTRQWWALSKDPSLRTALIGESTAAALARRLDHLEHDFS